MNILDSAWASNAKIYLIAIFKSLKQDFAVGVTIPEF